MISEEERYDRILSTLRKSKPLLTDAGNLEETVMERIQKIDNKTATGQSFFDYLFGWVYIGWIRKGLIAASVIIISLFAWQQSLILKRINSLEKQTILSESQLFTGTTSGLEEKLMIYKLTGRKSSGPFTISEEQLNRMLKSYSELQTKYSDLLKLIEDDPDLKHYIESKLSEKGKKKFNL
jgi:hypothetical protein